MELINYIGKVVRIDLKNGHYYYGTVEKADEDWLSLIDKYGKWIDISKDAIALIKEVNS